MVICPGNKTPFIGTVTMDSIHATVPHHFVETMLGIAAERYCDTDEVLREIGIDPANTALNIICFSFIIKIKTFLNYP